MRKILQKEWLRKSALPESPITLPRKKPKKGKSAVFRQTFLKFSRRPFWKNMGNRPSYFRLDPLELHRYLLEFKTNMNEINYEGIGKAFCEIRDELLAGSFSDSKNSFAKSLIAEAERFRAIKSANGSKGGRPRKNSTDTRGGSASPAGCASGKRIPPQEYTTAAGESAEKLALPDIGGSAASAGRAPRSPRSGEVSDSPKVSETPTTAELYDFAEAARLSEADAREWWELCTERGWKDRYGKPIRDWKKACERYCARRAINRMAKGET